MAEKSNSGLVYGLIAGIGALIIVVLVTLVVVSTIDDANLLRATAAATSAIESGGYINGTGYTLTGFSTLNRDYSITSIVNATNKTRTVNSANYTFNSATGLITNKTGYSWENVNVTYTYIAPTIYESSTDRMTGNFTSGIDNVSTKIPTILLIGAVVLLFGIIVFLVRQSQAMGIGTGQGSGSL